MVDSGSQSVVNDGEGKRSVEDRGQRSGRLLVRVSSTSALEKEGRIDGEVEKADREGKRFVGEDEILMGEGKISMGESERFTGESERFMGDLWEKVRDWWKKVGDWWEKARELWEFETEGEDEYEGDGEI